MFIDAESGRTATARAVHLIAAAGVAAVTTFAAATPALAAPAAVPAAAGPAAAPAGGGTPSVPNPATPSTSSLSTLTGTVLGFDYTRRYAYRLPTAGGMADHASVPATISLGTGSAVIDTYCLEMGVGVWVGAGGFTVRDWTSSTPNGDPDRWPHWQANKNKVVWVLMHSAPYWTPAEVLAAAGIADVPADQAWSVVRDATQSAVWKLANGADLVTTESAAPGTLDTVAQGSGVYRLYTWLLANAADVPPGDPQLAFGADSTTGTARSVLGPVALTTTSPSKINATPPAGVTLHVRTGSLDTAYTGVVGDAPVASGANLSLDVAESVPAGSVQVSAQASTPSVPIGTVWTSPAKQSLITANAASVTLTAATTFAWSAAPYNPGSSTPDLTTVISKPANPAAHGSRPVTRTFQIDRYQPGTPTQAASLARLDDDGRLDYREDRALWGSSSYAIVAVKAPSNASDAQLLALLNAATGGRLGVLSTTSPLVNAAPGTSYVLAWELSAAATSRAPWGAGKDRSQRFVARS